MSDLVQRARALAPQIIAARPAMEHDRRLPDDLSAAIRDAGLYRLCIPKAHNGLEADPRTLLETLEALAETDASAAWCAMISAVTGSLAAYLNPDIANAIFADPSAIAAGVYAPTGKATQEGDTYTFSGQWKWCSGGHNATWLCGGCLIMENGAPRMLANGMPDQRMMLFPASSARFIDTWHTTGLRGTGSGDIAIDALAIPQSQTVSFLTDQPRLKSPLYAFPIFGLLALGIAAVASGNVRAALKEFAGLASSKRLPTGRLLSERGVIQAAYADASARFNAARAFLLQEVDTCWREAQSGGVISLQGRAGLRLACTHLTRTSADIARTLQDLAGGAAVFTDNPLHRRAADAQTMTAHIMIAPPTYELTGRVLLGAPVSVAEL